MSHIKWAANLKINEFEESGQKVLSNENRQNTNSSHAWNQPYTPANPPYAAPAEQGYEVRLKEATKRVHKKLNFYRTLTSYIIINAFLWILWLMTGSSYPWPIWVSLGWGMAWLSRRWTLSRSVSATGSVSR